MTDISKFIEKSLYKVNGYIYQIDNNGKYSYNIIIARSGSKKFIMLTMFKDRFDALGLKLKDRVKVRFRIQCEFFEKYGRWINSLYVVEMEKWRKNDAKLKRQEDRDNYCKMKSEELNFNKSMPVNNV